MATIFITQLCTISSVWSPICDNVLILLYQFECNYQRKERQKRKQKQSETEGQYNRELKGNETYENLYILSWNTYIIVYRYWYSSKCLGDEWI